MATAPRRLSEKIAALRTSREGEMLGRYRLERRLAIGGMAEVWIANQIGIEGFERPVVLKRILPHLAENPHFIKMLLNEARIAARFNHPNLVQVYELAEHDGAFFIAMELVHGENLARLMRRAWNNGCWVAQPLALRIAAACCEGLAYAHSRCDAKGRPLDVVHRDISAQNVMVSFDGTVKLIDFGIARSTAGTVTTNGKTIKGKFSYMSPEQASGRPVDARSDLYSLGLVLYEMLTGVRPLVRETELGTLEAARSPEITPPSEAAELDPALDPIVMRALATDPAGRYADAREMQATIETYLVEQRWVVTSIQLAELMRTLFAQRLERERELGQISPETGTDDVNADAPAEDADDRAETVILVEQSQLSAANDDPAGDA